MATAATDQNGQYAITTMLPYGDYSVMATCPSYMASDTLYLTLNAGPGRSISHWATT